MHLAGRVRLPVTDLRDRRGAIMGTPELNRITPIHAFAQVKASSRALLESLVTCPREIETLGDIPESIT
jgi:hypothetical protein